jgi:hypothetical protein
MCQKDRQIETCNMPPEFSASFSSGCYSYPSLYLTIVIYFIITGFILGQFQISAWPAVHFFSFSHPVRYES